MRKINIYITQSFHGRMEAGEGKFCIYLELVNPDGTANPNTRQHMKGYRNTTKNRLALLACIEALSHVTEPCEVTIHMDSHYVAGNEGRLSRWEASGWLAGQTKVKNMDLWKRYQEAAEAHSITILAEKKHCYQGAAYVQLKKEMEMKEDNREEEKHV